jgi:hypothetical protein
MNLLYKQKILQLLIAAMISASVIGCSKDEIPPPSSNNNDSLAIPPPPAGKIKIKDASTLAAALIIDGAVVKEGNIPAPSSGNYGQTLEITTPEIILTSGNSFDMEIKTNSNAKILFIKIDGTDKYFQVTLDNNGNIIQSAESVTRVRQCCSPDGCFGLTGKGFIQENFVADATVQVFQPPLQGTAPDLSFLSDIRYWSAPKKIKYRCFKTGTGDVFVTLTWNKLGDVDLWLKEPNGNKIYFANRTSSTGGKLDYDNVSGYGPENIFYESTPPTGNYEVWVHYYSEREGPADWTVTLKNGSNVSTERGTLVNNKDSMLVKAFVKN